MSLRGSGSEKGNEKVDSRGPAKDERLVIGRVKRKSTRPAKPTCQKRQKAEENPEAESDERNAIVIERTG